MDYNALPVAQWQIFRQKMELIAQDNTRRVVPELGELADAMLALMDRIEHLERFLASQVHAHHTE